MTSPIEFKFYTDALSHYKVEKKDGEKEFYVEGYASTNSPDLVGDIVTDEALQSMLGQLKTRNIKVDVEHESWNSNGSPNIVPVGRVVDAALDEKGLWVRVKMNPATTRFSEVWDSIKGGFLDAFSIAFNGVRAVERSIGGATKRVITDLSLLNLALTGNPANPDCRINAVMAKSLSFATVEDTIMEPQQETITEPVLPPVVDAPVIKSVTKEDLELLDQKVADLKSIVETKSDNEEFTKELTEAKMQLKSLKEALDTLQLKTARTDINKDVDAAVTNLKGPLDIWNRR